MRRPIRRRPSQETRVCNAATAAVRSRLRNGRVRPQPEVRCRLPVALEAVVGVPLRDCTACANPNWHSVSIEQGPYLSPSAVGKPCRLPPPLPPARGAGCTGSSLAGVPECLPGIRIFGACFCRSLFALAKRNPDVARLCLRRRAAHSQCCRPTLRQTSQWAPLRSG
jgi:hypothetical protein